jgi:hypothetical protein
MATTDALQRSLGNCMGKPGGKYNRATNLVIDFAMCRARARWMQQSARGVRLRTLSTRIGMLRRRRQRARYNTSKVYNVGLLLAACYGAAVHVLYMIRRGAVAAAGLVGSCQMDAASHLVEEASWSYAVAPTVRYSGEVWMNLAR